MSILVLTIIEAGADATVRFLPFFPVLRIATVRIRQFGFVGFHAPYSRNWGFTRAIKRDRLFDNTNIRMHIFVQYIVYHIMWVRVLLNFHLAT